VDRDEKLRKLRELEKRGIVRELCPREDYWHFAVLKPQELPQEFQKEFSRLGELRW
jgi:hypothetical protein